MTWIYQQDYRTYVFQKGILFKRRPVRHVEYLELPNVPSMVPFQQEILHSAKR